MSIFGIFKKKDREKEIEDPNAHMRDTLSRYTPKERAFIAAYTAADYVEKKAEHDAKMNLYYQMTGRKPEEE